jgi:hypothetical protein
MPPRPLPVALTSPSLWAGAAWLGALGLWAAAMGPRLAAQFAFGPICSGHGLLALHCPACYAAAALAGAGALLAAIGVRTAG